ncbi:AMP binding protein [Mycena floridula]|nr:AMP binding protein [Mycena floridula]
MPNHPSPVPSVPLYHHSLFTHVFSLAKTHPGPLDFPIYIDAASSIGLTIPQLKNLALRAGYGLVNHPKVHLSRARGDVVCIFSGNCLSWTVCALGAIAAGLTITPANSAYTARELTFQYLDSKAHLVMTSVANVEIVRTMFKELGFSAEDADARIIVIDADAEMNWAKNTCVGTRSTGLLTFEDLLSFGCLAEEEKFDGESAHTTAVLCYSSGTTGKPKGVETTHHNLTSALDVIKPTFPKFEAGVDRFIGFLPFYHIYGLVNILLLAVSYLKPVVLLPRFDPEAVCAAIERYKVRLALVAPPVLVILAGHEAVDKYDLSSLRTMISGAAPLGSELVNQVRTRLSKRGCHASIFQGYGLTEMSPTTHIRPATVGDHKIGSVGTLLANLEARLVETREGSTKDAEEGKAGELWLRGPTVMKGYLNNPAATAETITPDGWLRTGDIAIIDKEGYYWIVDRKKELIKYKGFQVPPAELESLLLTHPDIADAAVIGLNNPKLATEVPRAYIVTTPEKGLTSKSPLAQRKAFELEVQKWVESQAATHKWLRGGVVILDTIPKSAAGKILRRDLRELAKAELLKAKL